MIVVDSNILFSALLSKNSSLHEILLNEEYRFVCPNYLFVEIFRHKEKIIRYSKLSEPELLELLNIIFSRIHFITNEFISASSYKEAINLCKDVDEKDTVFIALAIELNALLWTGDKKLIEGLTSKGFNQFFIIKSIK